MSDNDPTGDAGSTIELTPAASAKRGRRWPVAVGIAAIVALAGGAIAMVATRGDEREVLTLAESAQKTASQHTAHVEFTTNIPIPGLAGGGEVLATGEIDFDKKIVNYNLDITEMLKATTPNIPPGAGKVTAAAQGLTVYMNLAVFDQVPSLKGKWMKLDLGQAVATVGVDLGKVAEFEGAGPVSALAKLQALSDTVEDLGKEDVRGVSTTHYRTTYDFEKVYRARGAVTDEAAFAKLLEQYSSTTGTSEAWIDHDGLVRRTVNVLPLKAGTQTVKAEFFDFGVKVNPQIPSDADTFNLEDLQALSGTK